MNNEFDVFGNNIFAPPSTSFGVRPEHEDGPMAKMAKTGRIDNNITLDAAIEPALRITDKSSTISDDVLRTQVCQECFQYLSVGPITINTKGESICGRCNDIQIQTNSLYNILAQGLKFECTNHMNGCAERLPLAEMPNHEAKCHYKPQDCFFCSFSGNLAQIVNHASKCHPENMAFDGKIQFSLSKAEYKKTLLYLLNDNLYVLILEMTEELVKVFIQVANQNFKANHFGIKFFKADDPSDCAFVSTDYGLLHENFPNYFEKAKDHLKMTFGLGTTLCCQVLVAEFDPEAKELEIQKRYAILRTDEKNLALVQRKNESYNTAIKIIKLMSYAFFKCGTCNKNCATDMYFCQNIHFYCKTCLKTVCQHCKVAREYKNLKDLNFEVACEYAGCTKNVKIMQYRAHRMECSKRPYKCPLENCNETILSAERLIQHWHADIPKLCLQETIALEEYRAEEFFWLIKNDLFRVLVDFSKQNIKVLIDGINVLNNRAAFGYILYESGTLGTRSRIVNFSMSFCGRYEAEQKGFVACYTKCKIQYLHNM